MNTNKIILSVLIGALCIGTLSAAEAADTAAANKQEELALTIWDRYVCITFQDSIQDQGLAPDRLKENFYSIIKEIKNFCPGSTLATQSVEYFFNDTRDKLVEERVKVKDKIIKIREKMLDQSDIYESLYNELVQNYVRMTEILFVWTKKFIVDTPLK